MKIIFAMTIELLLCEKVVVSLSAMVLSNLPPLSIRHRFRSLPALPPDRLLLIGPILN
jgi:hypothetical protein